ncbi:MAG: cell division protein FtsQ/DivIB [Planctomycetales bacterium]
MARNQKTRNAPPPSPATPNRWVEFRRQLYRPLTLVTAASVLGLSFILPALRDLLPNLQGADTYKMRADQIQITQPPRWAPSNLVEQVVDQAELPEELSLLDPGLVQELANAFALHPWVAEVVSVQKSFPPRIEVQLTYRQPIAMVAVTQGKYPIDPEGILLPPQDFSPADARAYPLIAQVHSTPQGPAGTSWGDSVVTEAAQLAAQLAPYWKKWHLESIVCPRTTGDSDALETGVFVLTTTGGSQIIWGRGPNDEHPGEPTTTQKIERLGNYARKFGGLDQPERKFKIDIRHWRDIARSPLSALPDLMETARR